MSLSPLKEDSVSTTIYDVAKHAGVSTATVSKVLSGQPYVSDRTKARVLASVTELNYVPNIAAKGLAGAQTHIVGMVVSYETDFLFSDPHLLEIFHGVNRIAAANDYATLLSTAVSGEDKFSAYQRLLGQRYADGAIVEGSMGDMGLKLLRERGYPVVAVGYSDTISCVHSDDRSGARQMTEHLLSLGHRRIGIVAGPADDRISTEARLAGVIDAFGAARLSHDPQLITYGTFQSPSGYDNARTLMALSDAPTAIFAFNDRMAFGVMQYLTQIGLSVPNDVSVAGFDDNPAAARHVPSLTTIRQRSREQGERAMSLLLDMISNDDTTRPRQEIYLPTELIVRGSTGVCKAK